MARITAPAQYKRHKILRLFKTENGLDLLFLLLPLRKQYQLHEYYATDADLDEAAFREHRRRLDEAYPSMVHEAGKSYRLIERTFTKLSNDAGYGPTVAREILDRYRISKPEVTTISQVDRGNKRRTRSSENVPVLPITKRIDKKELAKVLLRLLSGRWRIPRRMELQI